jgi:hypothetical protein
MRNGIGAEQAEGALRIPFIKDSNEVGAPPKVLASAPELRFTFGGGAAIGGSKGLRSRSFCADYDSNANALRQVNRMSGQSGIDSIADDVVK